MSMTDELVELSPSQIKLWDPVEGCEARAAYQYFDGIREGDTPATARGKAIHAELEAYVLEGKVPRDLTALKLLPHAPAPGCAVVERPINFRTPKSKWRGFVDVTYAGTPEERPQIKAQSIVQDASEATIQDWKSTSKVENAKVIEVLLDDVQTNLYAYEAFTVLGAHRVYGKWVYGTTDKSPQAIPRLWEFERAKVFDVVGEIDERADHVQRLYQLRPRPQDLRKNLNYCYAYHKPCPALEQCKPNLTISFQGVSTMSVDVFKQQVDRAAGAPPLPGTAKAPPPLPGKPKAPPALPGKPVDANARWEAHKADLKAAGDLEPGQVDRSFINPPTAPATPSRNPEEMAARQGVEPPKAAEPDDLDALNHDQLKALAQTHGLIKPGTRPREKTLRELIRGHRSQVSTPQGAADAAAEASEREYQEDLTKSAPAPKTPPALPPKAVVTEEPSGIEGWAAVEKSGGLEPAGFTLYINCAPVGGDLSDAFSMLMRTLNNYITTTENVADYTLCAYGSGPGTLRLAYDRLWENALAVDEIPHGDLVVDARTPEVQVLLARLVERASFVVRGF
jgi:hypothetical protein